MNWLPLLDILHVALVQTFAIVCSKKPSACGEIQHRVILLSKEILLNFEDHGQPPFGDQWQAAFQALRDGLAKNVDAPARNGTSLDPAICNGLNVLVSETRNLARKNAGESWRYINRYWDSVGIIAERMKKECEAKYAPSLQTVFYWSSQATVQSLKILREIAKRHANDPVLYRTTISAIEDVRFGIRLEQIVNGSAAAKRRNCKRLLNWAIAKQQETVPTLTSGLPCLLPKHAPEAVAVFKRQMQDRSSKPRRYILNTLAMLFGEEAIKYLRFFLDNSPNPDDKRCALRALGLIGGPAAVAVLCEQLHDPSLCDEALRMLIGLSKSAGPQELIPTLTSGLPCLLPEPTTHVPAALETQRVSLSKTQAYVLNNVAFLFGVEAVQCFELFIRNNHPNLLPQKRGLRALGLIGGQGTVQQLCGLTWWGDTALCEETLKIIARLASVPEGVVKISEENPGRAIENVVMIVLNNLEELKRQNRANPRLIKRVEKKVLAYHKPM